MGRSLREASAEAFRSSEESPILATAELFARACIRAARLYPEWADSMTSARSQGLDDLARRLVARSGHIPESVSS